MLRLTLILAVSVMVSAAAPRLEVATCSNSATTQRGDCYEACFHICIAKGGTTAACEIACNQSPPCIKAD